MGHQKCSLQSARGPWAHCQALRRPTYVAAVHLQVAGGGVWRDAAMDLAEPA